MRYEEVKGLKPAAFKRLTGVKPQVFGDMVAVLGEAERKKKKAGRRSKLSLADKLLLALSYWREYRTQFHIAASYKIHESTANRIITQVEDALIASGEFSLPKRREVAETEWTVVLVDVTETPIERPKKSNDITTAGRPGGGASRTCRFVQDATATITEGLRRLPPFLCGAPAEQA